MAKSFSGMPMHGQTALQQEEAMLKSQTDSLAEVKKRRKDIERDALLLANRIALLK